MTDLLEVLGQARDLGFLGPGPVAGHVEQAAAFEAATAPPGRLLDLGSGGGVPGLVLAVHWAATEVTLLDAQLRRVRHLLEAVEALGIDDRVLVLHGRAEELARDESHRGTYDVVSARSFAPPGITAECGAGFLVDGGRLLVTEPPGAPDRWPADGLAALGLVDDGLVSGPVSSVRMLRAVGAPLPSVPRRVAAMQRSPRF